MAESKEELKILLMKVEEKSEKAGLKLNIQKSKITASGSFTSWQIDGGKVETVTDSIFHCSRITEDGHYSLKKKTLAPWKDRHDKYVWHIRKQRHHFADKGPPSQL